MHDAVWTAVAAVVLLPVLGGCAQVHEPEVLGVADAFYRSYASADGATACESLAPRTKRELEQSAGEPCARALLGEDLPVVGKPSKVEVFGTEAQVDYGDETTFLARFQGGWKVTAAGCTPRTGMPYDCTISGG